MNIKLIKGDEYTVYGWAKHHEDSINALYLGTASEYENGKKSNSDTFFAFAVKSSPMKILFCRSYTNYDPVHELIRLSFVTVYYSDAAEFTKNYKYMLD